MDTPKGKEPFVGVRKGNKKVYQKFTPGATYSAQAIQLANAMKEKRRSYAKGNVFQG